MARQFRAMGYFLTGAALEETSGYARGPSAAEPIDDAYIIARCPRLASVARYFKEPEWDATFALGLDSLIAGFAVASGAPRGVGVQSTSRGGIDVVVLPLMRLERVELEPLEPRLRDDVVIRVGGHDPRRIADDQLGHLAEDGVALAAVG